LTLKVIFLSSNVQNGHIKLRVTLGNWKKFGIDGRIIKALDHQAKELWTCPVGRGEDPMNTLGEGDSGMFH
jgi:hypothetical protein